MRQCCSYLLGVAKIL